MKVAYNWLKQYADVNMSPEKMGEILTDTGLEVEGITKIEAVKGGLQGVVVGEVMRCEKHPDADRLQVTVVNIGKEENLNIVCGAPNVAVNKKVVVATVGTTLYPNPDEPFKIKKSKIRGVESHGMICAEDELGIGKSHDGILLLPDDAKVGMSAAEFFELEDDFQFEIGLTPNRSDAMGHVGVARDLVAFLNVNTTESCKLQLPVVKEFLTKNADLPIQIEVEDESLCPKYMGVTLKNVNVEASPAWLQSRLRSVGLTPINNIVDATNFVMMELGTPLHAFDYDKLNGKIVVKTAKAGEKFTTLDEVERTLSSDNLMITNGEQNLCIAGVFGGLNSGISNSTTSIFLESAYFNPVSARKTAKEHGLNTDASFRFERGVDPTITELALKRCALLVAELTGAEIACQPVSVGKGIPAFQKVAFRYSQCEKLIGAAISKEKINTILQALDIEVEKIKEDTATLKVPAYRVDVTREADVIEEVLRIYGFNAVPIPEKMQLSLTSFSHSSPQKVQETCAEFLVGKGFVEIMNNSLTTAKYVKQFGGDLLSPENNVEILNPLSNELDVMRQNLLFQAMEVIAYNQNRQHSDLKLFEFGSTYRKFGEDYVENKRLLLVLSGKKERENWNSSNDKQSFFNAKGIALSVLERFGFKDVIREKGIKKTDLLEGIELSILKAKAAQVGVVNTSICQYFGIKQNVFIVDIDWDVLLSSLKITKIKFKELPKTFAVRRDFSLLLDMEITFSQIEEQARKADKKLLQEVGLFDVYEGKNLPENKKSYAVSFTFQDEQKTLKDTQVDKIMDKIQANLRENLGAELR